MKGSHTGVQIRKRRESVPKTASKRKYNHEISICAESEGFMHRRFARSGLSSDELFNELKSDLTWIDIKFGKILAFDQSLPHGYCLNNEDQTHWSLNCRFKGLHTPYWDKKLGEYFMPITVKNCTRLGMDYKHPINWT